MASNLTDYIRAGRALDADDREIAILTLQHVDALEKDTVDAAWRHEISRRLRAIRGGHTQLVDGEETVSMAHAILATRRAQ